MCEGPVKRVLRERVWRIPDMLVRAAFAIVERGVRSPMPACIAAAVLALCLLAPPAMAQVLRGTVVDTTAAKPLDRVRVIAFNASGARLGDVLT
jgi:hypothetical protein